jgi:arylsulfatase A-like enzyme
MKKRFKYILLATLVFPILAIAQSKETRRPNIIFILADDLGYGNLTSFNKNSPVPTPNIDKLAKEGIMFTRFYAGSTVCAPSRASLMTGLTMGHAWVRGNAKARDGKGAFRAQDTTLAQRLQANGYVTGMFGKWGLGDEDTKGAPHLKGFNDFFGFLEQSHAHNYYTDHLFEIRDNQTQRVDIDSTAYTEDLIVDRALNFVKTNKDKPFFLYLPITLPHAELRVPDQLMKRFQNADARASLDRKSHTRTRAINMTVSHNHTRLLQQCLPS